MFRFEGAWDSSLHNSVLVNRLVLEDYCLCGVLQFIMGVSSHCRVTPSNEYVFATVSVYVEVSVSE